MTADVEEDSEGDQDDVERAASETAVFEPLLAERLTFPDPPEALYMEEASVYRPIATGDIFLGVSVPGPSEDLDPPLAMLLSHPSAMRKGAKLEPWARAAPVLPLQGFSKKKWTKGHIDVFPLPLLAAIAAANQFEIDDRGWGVLLGLAAPVATERLDVRKRLACMSPKGIHILLQRLVHADTRVPVRDDLLAEVFAPKLEELEMLQTWNEEFVLPKVEHDGADLFTELDVEAKRFDDVMNSTSPSRTQSIRSLLETEGGHGAAQRLFATDMRALRVA